MLGKYHTSIGSFTRKSTFFWASVGATVGLANLWQFPYLASIHGGGLFILLYLACLLLVTLPLMVTEAVIGRHSRHGIVLAMDGLVKSAGCSSLWRLAGPLSVVAAFLVLSFTAVFGGIVLAYVFFGATDRFGTATQVSATGILSDFVSDPGRYREFMAWHAFFLILVVWVSAQGVVKGLERSLRIIVPCALLLMLALFALSASHGRLDAGVEHILALRPADVGFDSVQAALFHAFYTLGLGMGVWAIFGAYSTSHTRLKRSVLAVVLMDTLVAIMAGLMMFSVALDGAALDGQRGFGLLFVSLPVTLAQLPYSQVVITAVFLLVVMIVWATAISLLEPVVGWFREWIGAPRAWSAVLAGVAVWAAGLATLFSFNLWADVQFVGATAFRWLELLTGGILVPLVAILIATFAGWCLTRLYTASILGPAPVIIRKIWYWVMRLVLPVVVAWIGLQYTMFSLSNLCNNGSAAIWCGQEDVAGESVQPSQDEEPGDGQSAPNRGSETSGPQPGQGNPASEPVENIPAGDDILYHSV
ncbi:sodium-dependent transporter [Marinobacter halophilus]|uniref:Sodium-dependent transporter n=1 Tax=Marinobacter halophilus TaxID=1323740 RepID=A0A2T1KEP7_9GAMM|nr:sodium-dependent transporter [Marinobacter halophilus]PSF08604.1 sodium-dependent transporter [Marinobacter halophilus]GGC62049.1 transporter [Marinobacter halophilus]